MMGIGMGELVVILIIIMIIFGAGKLPEIGSAFGRSIKNFKTSMKEAEAEDAPAEGGQATAQLEENKNLSKEEQERLAREKAQAEGEAKDLAMKETAAAFTSTLPRKGSYDASKDVADKKA
ncbi:MAG: preprotein translocase [Nitrospinae bacterium RIFCSPLOWO2_12_FULL_47_7]|nr:MAG: preprotein translocase [Nitrospinae bacterium RIFCSPLOWO2_12_FULL_47_7]